MTFSELIRGEEEILKRLLLVSERQVELAQDGNATALTEYLRQRLLLWHEFETLEQQLEPHKGIPPEQRKWKNDRERQMTAEALDRCKVLMEQILANDQVSLDTTAAKMKEVDEQRQRVERGATVAPAYMRQSQLGLRPPGRQ